MELIASIVVALAIFGWLFGPAKPQYILVYAPGGDNHIMVTMKDLRGKVLSQEVITTAQLQVVLANEYQKSIEEK